MYTLRPGTGRVLIGIICLSLLLIHPAAAFTADSLDITVNSNGDATAVFRFTLQGLVENAIPQSMLEDQLKKGLSSGSAPPELISMDRSSATLLMKGFATVSSVPTGTEYQTSPMDFTKAAVALQNSGLSSVITADFAPSSITVTFPDHSTRAFQKTSSLPSITHIVLGTSQAGSPATVPETGTINVTSSPEGADVYLDGAMVGSTPGDFPGIAPGTHAVVLQKSGFEPANATAVVSAGSTARVNLLLSYVLPTTAPVRQGFPFLSGFGVLTVALSLVIVLFVLKKRA
ncbi:MAG TPA: PEGA domain-containing protein [Methanoregula sp.]|nr:PEGA domain-containing protein [Methanoregula sp.]